MGLFTLLEGVSSWQWIAFGCALLAAELLGAAGYLLWLGVSALTVGIILVFLPINWQLQWLTFSALSLLTTWLWWRKQSHADSISDEQRDLNQKEKQILGTIVTLEEDFSIGINRLKVADTTWSAQTDQALPAGTRVKIVAMNGIILTIEPHS